MPVSRRPPRRPAIPISTSSFTGRRARERVERLDPRHRVDEAVQIGARPRRATDRPRVDDLVGDQDPRDAEARHQLRLADGRRGHPPRARRELVGEQLRRHRRLAVRRERDAVLLAEPHHPRDVVPQPVAPQRQRRQQQVAGPQRQPELPDLPERDVREVVGQALRADAQRRLEQRVEREGHSLRADRYRSISAFVELSWSSSPPAWISLTIRWASALPSSTPHWSNEFTFQITPCTKTLCS